MQFGVISVLIPLLVILFAAITKRIIPALIIGILAGGILLCNGNVLDGSIAAVDRLVKASTSEESLYIIMFLFVYGGLAEIMKLSGGIKGFANLANRYVKTERGALFTVWAVSIFTFIDCCFHAISAGTVGNALIDKVKGNKYKLAFVINVTSCLLIILIPFGTTYVGYIVSIIASSISEAGVTEPAYSIFVKSIPFNFYAIIMLLISLALITFNFGFTKIVHSGGKTKESAHNAHEAHHQCEFEQKAPPRALNLIVPLVLLVASTFFLFWYTGNTKQPGVFNAMMNADFEKSILVSAVITVVLTTVFYLFRKIPMRELESHFLSGGNEMITPIIVLVLSWGLSAIVKDLGFADFVRNMVANKVPAFLLPAALYLIGCAASYFMGTAWGTWALLMPIAIPLAVGTGLNIPLVVGAVLAGGSLGDNASPLGETAILSATISKIPLMEHIKSQLPISLVGIGGSAILFVVASLIV